MCIRDRYILILKTDKTNLFKKLTRIFKNKRLAYAVNSIFPSTFYSLICRQFGNLDDLFHTMNERGNCFTNYYSSSSDTFMIVIT